MIIAGLQKSTLIDFPGRIACTVFTLGCNFRCPFCHNKDLLNQELFKKSKIKSIEEKDFFDFLNKRKKILDGVCITGGEPSLNKDLKSFCGKIKSLGLEIKLDTNGTNPLVLKNLIKKKLIDFVAMDIKASFNNYSRAAGVKFPLKKIKESIRIILKSGLEYELRTTIVPGIHSQKEVVRMALDLKKITQEFNKDKSLVYILQSFQPQNCFDPHYLKIKPNSLKKDKKILKLVKQVLPKTKLRRDD
ncbi:anaerobic ribonucleoside-triphosphate reductase activating protein [Candidatus Beckwithbacteria bacterium CG10_big_fil_rev_8_21_14_0_10_34_10]|uniref:Anaerobic ribonucleoside-triphosphate reductase activating protein n=1 Tax=Candidatus Beckwithbacteria bacterium CG10_big_fil_rev_8_21_14_0_10_34_10 TaxID=1974495 RepID=A0A2H0W824_9BACT|nr:MAG: anaerobic ribonucleoside-triphosphate reductase activating protein [Candidatus Beckwithbacteria bacterium CG10_big_fil_rev_8_21_14_0_10_34_10]